MKAVWHPSPMELKCLRHLDATENWKILGREKPPKTDVLPWRPFRQIFVINFIQFVLILSVLFFLLETGSGMTMRDIQEDLPYGLGIAALFAIGLGLYVTHLYRRSWNRRAHSLAPRD